ncbi:MAG TPA: hypothetical protein VHN37_16405 [Actinomycetota bacterium]|nr:hypothetical protein [Actinomycetota bacterium]
MAIVGVWETKLYAGTIGTTETFTKQHNFAAPGLDVWSRPYLQSLTINDDDASVILSVSKFTDKNGTHTGPFTPGIFGDGCTSVTFKMSTRDCIATAVLTTEIFG